MSLQTVRLLELKSVALLAAALVLAAAGPASAGPYDPDYRGERNSVHAIFDWASPASDWDLSVFETGPSAYDLDDTAPEAFDDDLDSAIILPNFVDPLPLKLLRIQLFFDGFVEGSELSMDVLAHDGAADPVEVEVGRSTNRSQIHYVDWEIRPNPDWEEILVFGVPTAGIVPGNLLRFEIDTISIPEPGSLLLLGIGLAGLIGCVRKRRTC